MGVFSTNGFDIFGATEIVAREDFHTTDINRILYEGAQNDMAFFEAIMVNDFNEAKALKEGTLLESEIVSLNEASVSGYFEKLKEMIKKIFEKIKGVFKAFYVKLTTIIVRDGKALVKKHEKSVLGKDFSKMKYKYCEPNHPINSMLLPALTERYSNGTAFVSEDSYEEAKKRLEDDNLLEFYLNKTISGRTSRSEFAKDAAEYFFKDKEEKEGLAYSDLKKIMDEISTMKDALKTVKKAQEDADKKAKLGIDGVKKMESDALDKIKKEDKDKTVNDLVLRSANIFRQEIAVYQEAVTKITAAKIAALKFENRQNRSVFAKAVSFNPNLVKESSILFDAIDESVEYELDDAFDNYEY